MKTIIFSHKADIDGLSPVVFLKLIRDDLDVCLLNAHDINPKMVEFIRSQAYKDYDEIFVTDLSLDKESCDMIMNTGYSDRFHTFDHHAMNLTSNDYPFGTAISTDENGINQCATSLFYEYLRKKYPETFDTPGLRRYSELVRLSDTWDWVKVKENDANKLSELQSILGRDEFVETYVDFFKNNTEFYFTEKQNYILDIEEKRTQRYIEESERTMFHAHLCGYPCGIVFAELHRSLLGNYLAEKYAHQLDFIVIINMQQGISFRSFKDHINVGEIATVFGGGGHVKSSGAPMFNNLKREVIKLILNNKNMFNIS